jgi:NADH dehydrogenase (ubiquinone) Fe-S protein 4
MLAFRLTRASAPALSRTGLARMAPLSSKAVAAAGPKGELSTEKAPVVDRATLSAFTGAPTEMMENRVVKIYQQAQTVQNATQNMIAWRLQWEDDHTKRWSNPLMGWTSTSDPLSNTHMTVEFASAEDAARFCQQNGWNYEIAATAPNAEIQASPKKYSDNFKWKGPPGRDFPDLYKPPPPPPPPPKS